MLAFLTAATFIRALSTLALTIAPKILTLLAPAAARTVSRRTLGATAATAAHSTRALFACRNDSSELSRAGRAARHDKCVVINILYIKLSISIFLIYSI
jgi:hypothetical protein